MSNGVFDPTLTLDAVKNATKSLEGTHNTEIFDLPFDLPISNIVEYKEYWIVGIIVLLLIGYYSYSIVMKNSGTLKDLLNNNLFLNKGSNKDSNKLK
jgi:hypothetical protein